MLTDLQPSHLSRPAVNLPTEQSCDGAAAVWSPAATAEESAQLARFLGNENRFLAGRVKELECHLRRRTMALSCALLASLGTAGALAIFLFVGSTFDMLVRPAVTSTGPVAATAAIAAAENRSAPSGSADALGALAVQLAGPVAPPVAGRSQQLEPLELEDEAGRLALPLG